MGWPGVGEMACQWWYGLVDSHSVREPRLDEALATYSVLIALEDTQGPEASAKLLASQNSDRLASR